MGYVGIKYCGILTVGKDWNVEFGGMWLVDFRAGWKLYEMVVIVVVVSGGKVYYSYGENHIWEIHL